MNRLRTRLSLAFIGIIILVISLPFIVSWLARTLGFIRDDDLPQFVENLPPDVLERLMTLFGQALLQQFIFLVVATAIAGGIAGLLVSRSLTAPLIKLVEAAKDIGKGNLNRRVEIEGTDEIIAVSQAFNDMAGDLENAETLRQNLLADVAHELRTPLTVLQGNLRAILDDVYPLEKNEISRLYDQTRHLTRLVHDLQELAQAEAKRLPLNIVDVDVATLVKDTAVSFKPIAAEADITLRVELLGTHPHIQADNDRLRQCLFNLLDNALRNTPADGMIIVQTEQVANEVQIRVHDTGSGIEPDQLDHVFDRFYRTDVSRSRSTGGSGLGLAIVHAMIEVHGGQITVASKGTNMGSTFVMHFPI